MKAYLVDPFKREITEVEHTGDYKDIYKLIDCICFDAVRLGHFGDAVFIDDEGLIIDKQQEFFTISDYPQPLAGKGLVLGCDSEGNSTSPKIPLDVFKKKVGWVLQLGHVLLPLGSEL